MEIIYGQLFIVRQKGYTISGVKGLKAKAKGLY
jgi:hypothetical protein